MFNTATGGMTLPVKVQSPKTWMEQGDKMKRFEVYKTATAALKALDRFCAQKGECENCPYSDDRAYMPYIPGEPTYNCAVRFLYDHPVLMKVKTVKQFT